MSLPAMHFLYSALLAVALILSLPYWLWQWARHGKHGEGLGERLGRVPRRLLPAFAGRTIWIHAVSVGEVMAIKPLAGELARRFPQYPVVISTTTATGQKLARTTFGEDHVFYFPLDFAFAIRPYLRRLQPRLVVVAETELWPNFLRLAAQSGAAVAIVNARISDRSFSGYQRFRGPLSRVLGHVDLFLTQTEADARRLCGIGAPSNRVEVGGNLKFDAPLPAPTPIVASLRGAFRLSGAGPIIVCGSTVEGEEPLLLRALENVLVSHPRAVMLLAPRHPERFTQVAQLLESLGIRFWRRSLWSGEALAGGVLLIDSIGELASLYALADVAFVGGSLVPRGGHNIIEPAQMGIPIIVGNHTENFRDIIALFETRDAIRIVGPAEFPLTLIELLNSEESRAALGRRGAEVIRTQTGATERTLDALTGLLRNEPPGKAPV